MQNIYLYRSNNSINHTTMMKQTLLPACAAFLLLAGGAQAQTVTVDGIVYSITDYATRTAQAVGYEGAPVDVAIPATVEINGADYAVTSVGGFSYCASLQSITLPEGLQSIGIYAFSQCAALRSVTLPEGLQTIDREAFSYCAALQSINFPEGLQTIGQEAFKYCAALQSIDLPEGLQTIDRSTFNSCTALQNVILPEGLQTIGDDAFYECTSLQSIDIPQGVTGMGPYAFMYCTSLQSVALPDGLQNIGDGAFYGCDALQSVTALGATPPAIEVQTFGKDAYTRTALHVPEGAEEAYRAADYWGWFWNAAHDGITYGIHGNGQNAIALHADENITAANIPATANIDGAEYPVTAIGNRAFQSCAALQSATFPEGLQSIGDMAFYSCTALQSIDLPEGLQTIGESAFAYCDALQSAILPEGLQTIGYFAFESCESLENVTLPSTLQNIHARAFYECPLTDVHAYAATPPAIYNDSFDSFTNITATLHVPSDAVASYQAADGWKLFQHIVGDLPPTAISSVATDASLAIYANGILTTESPASITVYAQNGAVVRHATDATSLPLAGLPRGIYIISIAQDGQQQVMKVAH